MKEKNTRFFDPVPSEGLFDRIRAACRKTAAQAEHVKINEDKIEDYAKSLPVETIARPELHPERHYLGQGEGTLAFFLVLDSVNFGSGYFPCLKKRPGMSGYFTVASSLKDWFVENGPMDCPTLSGLIAEDCASIFGQDPGNKDAFELMSLFARALNDLGDCVGGRFEGSFALLVESAGGSCEKLASLLSAMPFFRDMQIYKGHEVPFFKRAQLTAADLALAFDRKGFGEFHDLDRMTIFADNLVPHVLRMDGILSYHPDLVRRIDGDVPIVRDSPEEIEIRACALDAAERIKDAINDSGGNVNAMGVDYLLWNRGQGPWYKKTKPRHRCRSVFY